MARPMPATAPKTHHMAGRLLRFPENVRLQEIGRYTYASRKRPDLMHYAYYGCMSCRNLFSIDEVDLPELLGRYWVTSHNLMVESWHAARTYAKLVRRSIGRSGGLPLDVRCEDGAVFEESIKERLASRVMGVEPSLAAAEAASAAIRPSILRCL